MAVFSSDKVMITLYSLLVTIVALINSGPRNDDPNLRVRELIHTSEKFGPIDYRWEPTDQPSLMQPERVHGGIQ